MAPTTQQLNNTRFADAVRDGVEHMLNFFATEDLSELSRAESILMTARVQTQTNQERLYVQRLITLNTRTGMVKR
ncbi:hypothetical protein HWB51_gp058 [Mycobacterium phage Cuke]|uniref:Uncharacterized protein n=1 Tax=Mycobacterium phage Cuke TaxID=2079417 RepID=A0A2L1IWX6_9CAUD|nr:hypothetical protein HWB51_gp058 [Mycobacterium phage Cuke]AVD99676.1 hypothetical protein SEA_CUKE_58 [Mycobacterium phage Cuke]